MPGEPGDKMLQRDTVSAERRDERPRARSDIAAYYEQ